jgi:hypothetical protein
MEPASPVVAERAEHTLAFVMSLPISPAEYTAAKILANLEPRYVTSAGRGNRRDHVAPGGHLRAAGAEAGLHLEGGRPQRASRLHRDA